MNTEVRTPWLDDDQHRQSEHEPPAPEVKATSSWYRHRIAQLSLAGMVGGLLTWGLIVLCGAVFPDLPWAAASLLTTLAFFLGIGLVVSLWDGIVTRSWAKTRRALFRFGPALVCLHGSTCWIISKIYPAWIGGIVSDLQIQAQAMGWSEAQFREALSSAMLLPRGVTWAILGLATGLLVGISTRNRGPIITGALGGVIGGLLGGLVFGYFEVEAARVLGITVTGLAISLALALVRQTRLQHRLEIVGGGMAGREFLLTSDRSTIGTAPGNDVTLTMDPFVAPVHAVLRKSAGGLDLAARSREHSLLVNGAPFTRRELVDGDVLQLGSTMLRYRNVSEQSVAASTIAQ